MVECDVIIESEKQISATLSLPSGSGEQYPAVIMIHGSGPIDRNENAKKLKMNTFKEMAALSNEEGFATIRYDKRGVGESKGDYYKAGFFDFIEDAVAVVNFVKSHRSIDENRIFLLGHSEGCLVAPVVHDRVPVQGMILLSPSAEPLGETTAWQREQMKRDMQTIDGFQGWLLRLIKADQKLDKMNEKLTEKIKGTDADVIHYNGQKINAKWNREHEHFDVREYLTKIDCPVLTISGMKDVQVKSEQAEVVCNLVKGECESHILPDVTHLLRKTEVPDRFSSIMNDYKNQVKQPIDPELKQLVSDWLRKH